MSTKQKNQTARRKDRQAEQRKRRRLEIDAMICARRPPHPQGSRPTINRATEIYRRQWQATGDAFHGRGRTDVSGARTCRCDGSESALVAGEARLTFMCKINSLESWWANPYSVSRYIVLRRSECF